MLCQSHEAGVEQEGISCDTGCLLVCFGDTAVDHIQQAAALDWAFTVLDFYRNVAVEYLASCRVEAEFQKNLFAGVKVSVVFLLVVGGIVFAFAPQVVSLFRDDPDVIRIGTTALRFQCALFPSISWIAMSALMEQVIGRTAASTFISVARQGMFFIPAVLILSATLGVLGIQMSQAVADLLTFACAIPIHIQVMRSLPKEDRLKV